MCLRPPLSPSRCDPLGDLPTALAEQGTELRVVRSLWPLHDAILRSSLGYSFIRLHFAAPRELSAIAAAGEAGGGGRIGGRGPPTVRMIKSMIVEQVSYS
jgi:hypothetical protein